MRTFLVTVAITIGSWLLPEIAAAQIQPVSIAQEPVAYAIVIGNNIGGPGQQPLQFAEDDARRVKDVLISHAGYLTQNVISLRAANPADIARAIGAVSEKMKADAGTGRTSRLLFYYSGHAKATALSLGQEDLPLAELRATLLTIPTKLTVVVLDACQSGSFSGIKGASPAADFSFNSKSTLDSSGLAVMASSTGSELSQESPELRSSFFTFHLLGGLRGAADNNRDGKVSIDEAYRYAYNQTLIATAKTAVGGQHVTLEMDVKGHGEITLSMPQPARAKLTLAKGVKGHINIEQVKSRSVIAEMEKGIGDVQYVAVTAGEYRVLVRDGQLLHACKLMAVDGKETAIDLSACQVSTVAVESSKGSSERAPRFANPWEITIGYSRGSERRDAYIMTLERFSFRESSWCIVGCGFTATTLRTQATHRIAENFSIGAAVNYDAIAQDWRSHSRTSSGDMSFDWNTAAALAVAVIDAKVTDVLRPYAQFGVGLGVGRTTLADVDAMEQREWHIGYAASVGAGLKLDTISGVVFGAGYRFDYSPIISNLLGETHVTGGHRVTFDAGITF
jgi:hypothetical protein